MANCEVSSSAEMIRSDRGGRENVDDHIWTLIDPPFLPRNTPSLEISVLAAVLGGAGVPFERPAVTQNFATRIGADVYDRLSGTQGPLGVGDFVGGAGLRKCFAPACNSAADPLQDFLLHIVEEQGFPFRWQPAVHLATDAAVPFTEDWADRLSDRPRLIVLHAKYQQLAFALSIAEALSRRAAGHRIVLTGDLVHHNGVGDALLELFPFLDAVARSRIEESPEAVRQAILKGATPPSGLITRSRERFRETEASPPPVTRLTGAALAPDYGGLHDDPARPADASVPLRLSVGCAWGDQIICSFCGLIPEGQSYVIAQPAAALEAIISAVARTGCRRVVLADLMVDERLIEGVFAPLAASGYDLEIYAEVRPNLSLEALETLRRAGVREILAGIESLDLDTLKSLRKGQHPAAMVRFLRDVESAGLSLDWQILHGLPLDTAERAIAQAGLAAQLTHLPAPFSVSPIRIERGSPIANDPAAFGFSITGPARHTALAFGQMEEVAVSRFCNEFSHRVEAPTEALSATRKTLFHAVADWVKARRDGRRMAAYRMPGGCEIKVTDTGGSTISYRLDAMETAVFDALAAPADRRALGRRLPELAPKEIDASLSDFLEAGLAVEAAGRFVHVVPRAP